MFLIGSEVTVQFGNLFGSPRLEVTKAKVINVNPDHRQCLIETDDHSRVAVGTVPIPGLDDIGPGVQLRCRKSQTRWLKLDDEEKPEGDEGIQDDRLKREEAIRSLGF